MYANMYLDNTVSTAALEILHVTEAFGGGVATAMAQYAESFASGRHRALVSARRETVGPDTTRSFTEIEILQNFRELANTYTRRTGLPDVIHCHSSKAGVLVRSVTRPRATRIVYSPHALAYSDRDWYQPRYWAKYVEALLRSRADAYGAVSAHEADQLHQLGIPRSRIFEVPHYVPVSATHRPAVMGAVVAVGRLCSQKDPAFFAATVTRIREHPSWAGRQLEFIWLGDGDGDLARLLQDAGVQVTGWMGRPELLRFLEERAALIVHGARYEGLPMALVEAMSLGVPVVARRIPSLAQLESITLVDSPAEAAEATRSMLDTDLLVELGAACKGEVRRKFGRSNQREALEQLYGVTG